MLVEAKPENIAQIVTLVNTAYRSKEIKGWTSEAMIVEGSRINDEQVSALMSNQSKILLMFDGLELIGCVHVENMGDAGYIGMLTTHPHVQNRGIGKHVLQLAEKYLQSSFSVTKFTMSVLSARKELIAFYQRRGYQLTEQVEEYPVDANVGQPLCQNLKVLHLIKTSY